jgi:hypothetical protein
MTFFAFNDKVVIADKFQSQNMGGGFGRDHIPDAAMVTFNDARKIIPCNAKIDNIDIGWWLACGSINHCGSFEKLCNDGVDIWPIFQWQALSGDSKLVKDTRYAFIPVEPAQPVIKVSMVDKNTRMVNVDAGCLGSYDDYVATVEAMLPGMELLTPLESFVLASEASPHVTLTYDQLDRVTGVITYDHELTMFRRTKILRGIKRRMRLLTKTDYIPYLNKETDRTIPFPSSV